jgi:hypothetical protein
LLSDTARSIADPDYFRSWLPPGGGRAMLSGHGGTSGT